MKATKKSKVLTAARSVFLRHGYRRVSMNDIAEAAGVSRAALYMLFKGKEELFIGVFMQWVDETIDIIELEGQGYSSPEEKLVHAFEIWAVRPFEMITNSPEVKELVECSFDFAQLALREGHQKFEAAIVPLLSSLGDAKATRNSMRPEQIAHVLASAVRGLKQTATTSAELRRLIKELLMMPTCMEQ